MQMDISNMSEKDLEENLKELLDKESREERKANGRLVAVIVASFLIFLAIYHAWIRKTAVLAGILVPALIMILYGGWVVILAKRDKRKRELFEKKIEEVARAQKKNKELIESQKKAATKDNAIELTTKNEKQRPKEEKPSTSKPKDPSITASSPVKTKKKSPKSSSPHRKRIKTKRPSMRQRLLRQNAVIETPNAKIVISCKEGQKRHPFVRTSSAP